MRALLAASLALALLALPLASAGAVDSGGADALDVPAAAAATEAPRCTGLPCDLVNLVCGIVLHRQCVA